VYCSLSGYGQDGPYRDVKAYDLLIQGESGILLTNGQPDAPAKVGLPITDLIGGLTAALGVVGALLRRERTGEGAYLDVAMLDSAVSWLGYFPQHAWHGGGEPPRTGMRHQYLCPYGPYLAADGRWVSVVVATPSDWERFCTRVVRRPEWLDDLRFADAPSRRANRSELEALVEAAFREEPADVWLERLQAAGLPHGEVRTIASVLSHPQLLARRMFVEATSPVGTLPIVRFPLGSPDAPRHIPALGEHSAQVLAEIGYPAG
jgi:itaconate CoA-transferase